jgi:transmembrane sensor
MNEQQGDARDEIRVIEDEAIEWLIRMRGPDAASLRGRFEQWLMQSAEHRRAYEWATRHFANAEILKASGRHGSGTQRRTPVRHWLTAGAALAAAASLLLVMVSNPFGRGDVRTAPVALEQASPLVTRRGEIRTFRLADGSSVTLDTDSELAFAMDASARRLDLARGKARFTVAHDARPFVVTAGAGKITASAATFDVGYDEGRQVMVSLIGGQADLQSAVYMAPTRQVFAGQRFAYRASDFMAVPISEHLRSVNDRSWPSGWVEYRAVPLDVLIAQANRYADRPVILDGSAIGALVATGRFRLTDTDAFANRLAEVFDLDVSRRPDGIHLSGR